MSRVINNDHPWTSDEIQYKLDRHLDHEVEENRREFPPDSPVKDVAPEDHPPIKLDPEDFERIKNADAEWLKSELSKRDLPTNGDEKELKVRLAQAVQAEKEKDASNA